MKYRPPPELLARLDEDHVEAALRELYLTHADSALRPEERKKIPQVAGLLRVLARTGPDPFVVDAAAGRAPVGLIAARLLGCSRVVVVERDPERAASARRAAERVLDAEVEVREGDVADAAVWPVEADVVVALHACGPAFDEVVDHAVARRVPWVIAVPCCYADAVRFSPVARAWADQLGVASQAPVRRRFIESMVDTERTLRLEAAGYRVSVQAFVPPAVTPHNLVWKAERVGPSRRATEAKERWRHLVAGPG